MSDQDNADRDESGVICYLREQGEGKIRLVLDDAFTSTASQQVWEIKRLFTWRDFDQAAFFSTEFSERDLADIGLALVTRLAALAAGRKRG
jgi:hypothetical protein